MAAPYSLDLVAAAKAQDVETMLRWAGVPPNIVERALGVFPGLRECHPHHEVLRRLEHLAFLMDEGVYTFDVAMELIATQARFLEMRFGVVYEDEHLLVLNKPSDVRMDVPQREGPDGGRKWPTEHTCSDWLDTPGLIDPPLDKKRFCHNLDSATSGILCVAKTQEMAARCVELFAQRRVQKECRCLLWKLGMVNNPSATSSLYLPPTTQIWRWSLATSRPPRTASFLWMRRSRRTPATRSECALAQTARRPRRTSRYWNGASSLCEGRISMPP